ncbi:MAG: TrmH family RNA methyltransferase [Patescibacteria group bacterium]
MPNITLLLHNIRSTHNVGSIFRTADGFGVQRIILTGYTPHPTFPGDTRLPHLVVKLQKQIEKTALSATSSVPFEYHDNLLTWLDGNTLPLVALEQSEYSVTLKEFHPPSEFVLVLGEEVDGIPADLLAQCESIVEIPMKGQKESFNVSVAAAIALYAMSN